MEGLDHPLKEEIGRLRAAILDSNDRITEHIKWKAPSFRYAGEDRVTFRLYPEDRVQLPTTGPLWRCGMRRPGNGTWWSS